MLFCCSETLSFHLSFSEYGSVNSFITSRELRGCIDEQNVDFVEEEKKAKEKVLAEREKVINSNLEKKSRGAYAESYVNV